MHAGKLPAHPHEDRSSDLYTGHSHVPLQRSGAGHKNAGFVRAVKLSPDAVPEIILSGLKWLHGTCKHVSEISNATAQDEMPTWRGNKG